MKRCKLGSQLSDKLSLHATICRSEASDKFDEDQACLELTVVRQQIARTLQEQILIHTYS